MVEEAASCNEFRACVGDLWTLSDVHLDLQVCTGRMNLSDEVDLEDYVSRPDKISAAEVRDTEQQPALLHAMCLEDK